MIYDVAVIGSGPGGYIAATHAAELGLKTVCIEKETFLGGTCLNVGCIPSKALLASTDLYREIKDQAKEHGIQVSGLSFDFAEMMKRKEKIIAGFRQGIEGLFKKSGVEQRLGQATFLDAHTVGVGKEKVEARFFILATGSEPISLPFLPFDEKTVLSSTGALALKTPPRKMIIVGAGIIGVELGSVYCRLGTEVVFLEFLDRICPSFDREISQALQKTLTQQGMSFYLSHKVVRAEGATLTAQGSAGEKVFAGDVVLVAVGRRPVTRELGLEKVGLVLDAKGFLPIDASFRTAQPHIFAIGDLVEGPMLAHKASEEGAAVAKLLAGHSSTLDYLSIPSVAYTNPEVAAVGLTEEEVQAKSLAYRVGRFPFKANSRARCNEDVEGFVKVLAEEKSRRLLGVHILGKEASELIAEAAFALARRSSVEELAKTCHAHPTLSEAVKEAALAVFQPSRYTAPA